MILIEYSVGHFASKQHPKYFISIQSSRIFVRFCLNVFIGLPNIEPNIRLANICKEILANKCFRMSTW